MNAVCNGVTGALSEVGKFAKDAGNAIGGFFTNLFGRKKRSAGCVPPVIPTLSMTSVLTHCGAHSTGPSYRPKINNQPLKKFLCLAIS